MTLERHIELNRGAMFGLALKLTRSYTDAEDVVAEAVLRMLRAQSPYRNEVSFKGYAYKVVSSVVLDMMRVRRRKQRLMPVDSIFDITDVDHPGVNDEPLALADFDYARAFAALNPTEKLTLKMHALDQLNYAEIAERTQVPVGTVRSRLNRARIGMREAYAQTQQNYGSAAS